MEIVSLVAAAFPSSLVKSGVRAENVLIQSIIDIETRFLACFRFRIFMVV